MRRSFRRTITAVVVLLAVIFSQLSISTYACATIRDAVVRGAQTTSTARHLSHDDSVVSMQIHGDLSDGQHGALCHSHCDDSAQSSHADQTAPADIAWFPPIWAQPSVHFLASLRDVRVDRTPLLQVAPPPSRILFQVFRT